MKRIIYTIILVLGIVIPTLFLFGKEEKGIHNRGCTGSANCRACSNCSGCGHCNSGGSCGVCSTGFTSSKSYASSASSKKKSRKRNSNTSNSYSSKKYSVKSKRIAVNYYNGNEYLTESNFLYTIYKTVNIRKGPGTNYSILEKVKLNTKLIYLSDDGNWHKVKVYNTGTEGYVYKESVK